MTRTIENLVFNVGGVLGIAYAGAIEALEKQGILSQVKRTAGTSAGAVAAALISLGYSSKEIVEVVILTPHPYRVLFRKEARR